MTKHNYGPSHIGGEFGLLLRGADDKPCVVETNWIERMVAVGQARGLIEREGGKLVVPALKNFKKQNSWSSAKELEEELATEPHLVAILREAVLNAQKNL